jgi:8-oxo-dGTP diphosphatase
MPYTPILATLGYVISADGKHVLLVLRNRRPQDPHYGKYNGLGGKLHADEDVVSCIRREVHEEAGLVCTALSLRGTISWPGFGSQGEDWFGFLFRVNGWSGEPFRENEDGILEWREISNVDLLPMWEGDRHFLSLIFERDNTQFHGVMPYRDGKPVGWSYSRLTTR